MKNSIYTCLKTALVLMVMASCQNNAGTNKETASTKDSTANTGKPALREKVLTKEDQQALTPDSVIQLLKAGNKRFVDNEITARNYSAMVKNATTGQYPEAIILSCIDSRVPVEEVFDRGIGDIFVARVAGNVVDVDVLGSMEYSCKESGAKLIVVLGHESCGAVKAAIEDVKLGNITSMLDKIKPAMAASKNFKGEHTEKDHAFVEVVTKNNILNSIKLIKAQSPILNEMEQKGEIKIVGAYYNLKTGEVTFL